MAKIIHDQAGQFLSEISPRDQKWDTHRGNTQSVAGNYAGNDRYQRLSERMCKCTTTLGFAELIDGDGVVGGLKLKTAMFCHVRNCPVCAWRKSLRNVARVFTQMPLLATLYPKASWLFLTLTVKNPPMSDLRTTLNSMNKAWQRLIQLQDWPAEGYIRATEITRDGNGNPHPHFHCLLLVKPSYFSHGYITQLQWAMNWQASLRVDYLPVIDIRKVKSKDQTIAAAVVETLKYAVKPGDVIADPEFLHGITDQCRKLRFLATGGVLKDVLKDSVGDNEMINTDLAEGETDPPAETVPSLFFGWRTDMRKYKLVRKVKV